jgi:hypothetical protein
MASRKKQRSAPKVRIRSPFGGAHAARNGAGPHGDRRNKRHGNRKQANDRAIREYSR